MHLPTPTSVLFILKFEIQAQGNSLYEEMTSKYFEIKSCYIKATVDSTFTLIFCLSTTLNPIMIKLTF